MNTNARSSCVDLITLWSVLAMPTRSASESDRLSSRRTATTPGPASCRPRTPDRTRRPGRHAGQGARPGARDHRRSPPVSPIQVELRGGTYFLPKVLDAHPGRLGTEQGPRDLVRIPGEQPVLSGGVRLTGWTRTKVNGHDAWVAKLPGGDEGPAIRELWLDGIAADPGALAQARYAHRRRSQRQGEARQLVPRRDRVPLRRAPTQGLAHRHTRARPSWPTAGSNRTCRSRRSTRRTTSSTSASGASSCSRPTIATGSRT